MSDYQNELEKIEKQIFFEKQQVKVYQALQRLDKNKDFQLIVKDGYLRDYALMLIEQRTTRSDGALSRLNRQLDAIAFLNEYLEVITTQGKAAAETLREAHMEQEELLELGEEGYHNAMEG